MVAPKRLANDFDSDQRYKKQIDDWKKATGKHWTKILKLSGYFFAERREQPELRSDTVTRTLQKRPVRDDGIYNLLTILGTLYLVGAIKRLEEIEHFLNKSDIPIPKDSTWEEIAQRVEEGAKQYRQNLKAKPRKRALLIQWGMGTIVGLLTITVLVAIFIGRQTPLASSVCSATISGTKPTFLQAQGLSVYRTVPNDPRSSILTNNIRSIGINQYGIWVGYVPNGTIHEVSYYNLVKDQWVHCPGLPLAAGQTVNSFAFKDDVIYVAVDGGNEHDDRIGVAQLTKDGWRFYTRKSNNLTSNAVYSLSIGKNGLLRASTYEGVTELTNAGWKPIYQARINELPSNHVHQFLEDRLGNRWFAFIDRGVSQFDANGVWHAYFTNEPGVQNARAIAVDDSDGVWVATDGGGMRRFYQDQWRAFTVASGHLPSDHVQDVQRDKFGRIWVATDKGVLYTADSGQTWTIHSTMDTWGMKFGCAGCGYDETHLWLVLRGQGLGHTRIPPTTPTIKLVSTPVPVKLKPGDSYVFTIEVQVIGESLEEGSVSGDGLYSIEPANALRHGAWPVIKVKERVKQGEPYVFSNIDNPIVAPPTPGRYKISWRIWQGKRFVSEPIGVEFEVVEGGKNP